MDYNRENFQDTLYGSVHTHFESRYDTGNDLPLMLRRFLASGAKKIAATEHGAFSSFEDLKDIAGSMRKKGKAIQKALEESGISLPAYDGQPANAAFIESFAWKAKGGLSDSEIEMIKSCPLEAVRLVESLDGFDVLPGVEGYFGNNHAHLILIAKDYEGYVALSKIISEANEALRDVNAKSGNPIITFENLRKNVAKGHMICTSACIAGPFGHLLGLDRSNIESKINKLATELISSGYNDLAVFVAEFEAKKAEAKEVAVRKYEVTLAEKEIKKNQDYTRFEELKARQDRYEELNAWLEDHQSQYDEYVAKIKDMGKAKYAAKKSTLLSLYKDLETCIERETNSENIVEAEVYLQNFVEIFGEENFYFELQNHGLEIEKDVYANVVKFACDHNFTHFIASNDIHVGARKTDPEYKTLLKRRNVAKFMRFNTYSEETKDDREYVIKTDQELFDRLLEIIPDTEKLSKEEIIGSALQNIKGCLSECEVNFPKNENHYPKFCDDENAEFERKVREGIKERFPDGFPDERYEKRLEYELDVIKRMGYAGYHLIVADYLEYGRLLGYLPTPEEIKNAPENIEDLRKYIMDRGYPMIGYNIGPGRGSGAGSLACYGMGITDIDPIPYNLLFERFLNVERVSMPDIDSDFRTDIRDKVVSYCRTKYGAECICQIMTKSYSAPKGGLRLAARYLGDKAFREQKAETELEEAETETETPELDEQEMESVDVDILLSKEKNEDIKEFMRDWYNRADKLAKEYDKDGDFPETFTDDTDKQICELAKELDGLFTGYGQHAAGTIISGDDVREILPLMWNSKKGSMETQCTMAQAEAKGLLKMDFLGLRNLDIITRILRRPSKGVINVVKAMDKEEYPFYGAWLDGKYDTVLQDYKLRDEMLKDSTIYRDIFSTGLTHGVFQFESPGMKKMLIDFKPETFEDIILLVAAYRPGPMQYLPEIIAQKQYNDYQSGKTKTPVPKPEHTININNQALNDILSPTYGCIIYQEQVMQIFQNLAGYSLGGADLVRRAMSKKHLEELVPERAAFIHGDPERGIEGCVKKQGISEKEANDLFDQMMEFAKYAFNKSHATAYALVAMFTAYLKKYHTADFFRDSLNYVKAQDEIPGFIQEFADFGLTLKGPSLTESENLFSVEDDGKSIRFGLQFVKGFSAQDEIVKKATVQEFVEANPGMSLKVVEKYAMLGLFTGAWARDLKYGRCANNRHECLRWIREVGPTFVKYQEQIAKTDELKETLEILTKEKASLIEQNEPTEEKEKEISKVVRMLHNWTEKRKASAAELNAFIQKDYTERRYISETTPEILENRKWETELLSVPFDISGSMKLLKTCQNKRTFNDLKIAKQDDGSDMLRIPAIVLNVSGVKTTKKSGMKYYDVTLMDREANIIVRRFDEQPTQLEGEFMLAIEECKYFTCKLRNSKRILTESHLSSGYIPFTSDAQEKAVAIANGGHLKSVCVGGNRNVTVYEKSEPAEEERE